MRKALFVLLFGLFPLWAVLLILVAGEFTSLVPHIYADSAPWLLVAAVLCTVVTLSLSLFSLRRRPQTDAVSQTPNDGEQ
jgi:hypothetical protein